jgi:hypothetical protein
MPGPTREQLLEPKSPGRYFSPWQVLVGAIVGGPLAGGFLIASDYGAFGTAGKGRVALAVSCAVIVAGVLLQNLLASHLDPADGSIVAGLVAGLYGVHAQVALTGEIARRRSLGWQPHSWPRVLGISLGFFAAMILLVLVAAPQLGMPP